MHVEDTLMKVIVKNDDILEKYNEIWRKVKNSIEK